MLSFFELLAVRFYLHLMASISNDVGLEAMEDHFSECMIISCAMEPEISVNMCLESGDGTMCYAQVGRLQGRMRSSSYA